MNKIYGSSSAFVWGSLVVTKYSSACLRSILLASHGVREAFDDKHMARGAFFEESYQADLDAQGMAYKREVPSRSPVPGHPNALFTGRADFVVGQPEDLCIVELKSTESSSVRLDVIRKGNWNLQNLAQLVAYMIEFKCVTGVLRYGYLVPKDGTYVPGKNTAAEPGDRQFLVEIRDDGQIAVDGARTQFNVSHQLAHRTATARVLEEQTVAGRPMGAGNWGGACKFCVFSSTCDKYDSSKFMPLQQFISDARAAVREVKK